MATQKITIGIIGGSGMLGRAMALALLGQKAVTPANLWISNRSGSRAGFEAFADVIITPDNQALADACDLILLSVPPALAPKINIKAPDRLVISVMAGVSLSRLQDLTGARRVVRAMSSPAAERGLAYSPWTASPAVTAGDRALLRTLFEACGKTDEVADEAQIETFTALTGPTPGFVAYYADCMIAYATETGIAPEIADRAIRQLFLAAGQMMADGPAPRDHVQQMVDYAGTTAAGLTAMRASPIRDAIAKGLAASVAKVRTMG
ncbi:MAG: NAD(P)-binding domain-containing protein [Paracoccaceae bacterium]|nr:NAD(P)-binding domain-containing protein [Paracoccaceae bacterium]MDH5529915.1 NAD(P)-binding domain-containing protein [Paracoccaceae bacterium]